MIASGVTFIMNGANHMVESISTFPFSIFGHGWEKSMEGKSFPHKGDTVVGNDVWLGYSSVIMPGISIGDGAIIASNSTVTKDVEPYSIVGGNPAREIRKRFEPKIIERLLKIRWWDWEVEKINEKLTVLTSLDIDKLEE